jgi:hypothetical protein
VWEGGLTSNQVWGLAKTDESWSAALEAALTAGKQAIIHTGKGTTYTTTASADLYWGRGWYVWNITGDKVILRRADGSLKDTCPYSGAGSKKYC